MENVAGEQGHKISFFNARDLKHGYFVSIDALFPFLAFFKL